MNLLEFSLGDAVLIMFPYTDNTNIIKRPALIIGDTGDEDVIVVRITSQENLSEFDISINDWKQANLLFPSFARIHKIATIKKKLIVKKLGKLSNDDLNKVRKTIKKLFNSRIS